MTEEKSNLQMSMPDMGDILGPGLSQSHPFGRESKVAIDQLWTFFYNNVYLGQWELARAGAEELYQQKEILRTDIRLVLHRIIKNPYGFSLGEETIRTPHNLSHLCLQEYMLLTRDRVDQVDLQTMCRDVDFRLLISEAFKHMETEKLKEIYVYHSGLQHTSKSGNSEVATLSKSTWEALEKLMQCDPISGVSILESLTPMDHPPGDGQELYVHTLQGILRELTNSTEEHNLENQSHMMTGAEKLYTLLALCSSRIVPSFENLKYFLRSLCKILSSFPHVIKTETIYSTLLGRDGTSVLREFCSACFDEILKVDGVEDEVLSMDNMKTLSFCTSKDRQNMWKHLSILSFHRKRHFLDLIMDTAMCLVKSGKFDDLACLLSQSELQPLRPLVLLVGWDHCTDVQTARCLLEALSVGQERTFPGMMLDVACEKLAYQVNLVEWCIENIRLMGIPEDVHSPVHQMSLLRLETQSILHMLHHSTRLQNLDHDQVLDMIRNRPSIEDAGTSSMSKKERSVHFAADTENENDVRRKTMHLDVDREIDAAMYRSYAVMNSFMNAIHFCADKTKWESYLSARHKQMIAVRNQNKHIIKAQMSRQKSAEYESSRSNSFAKSCQLQEQRISRSKSVCANTDGGAEHEEDSLTNKLQEARICLENFQEQYEEHVIEQLREGQKFFTEISPLMLQVETLENIFSMLFLMSDNITEDVVCLTDSGEEGAGPESRSGSRGDSRENLSRLNTSMEGTPSPLPICQPQSDTELGFDAESTKLKHPVPSPAVKENRVKTEMENDVVASPETRATPVGIFSITKTELKGTAPELVERKTSGNISNNSAASTVSMYKQGFILNSYIVRDILLTLRECLADLRAAKYRLIDQSSDLQKSDKLDTSGCAKNNIVDVEELNMQTEDAMNMSIQPGLEQDELQQRMSRLSQVINEALWRFQLIVDNQLPSALGKINMDKSHLEVGMDSDDDTDCHDRRTRRRTRSRRSTRGEISQSTGESEHYPTTNDESNASSGGWTQWPWKRGRQGQGGITEELIHLMLSDPETLLHLCLLRGRYNQAQQVVKMFGLADSNSVTEVRFSEHFAIAVKTLQNLTNNTASRRTAISNRGSQRGSRPNLSTIANVAAAGMVTVSATTTVDQILSLNLLPRFSPEVLESIWSSASPLASFVDPSLVPAMVIFDLACVAPSIYESANNLVEMMKKRQSKKPDDVSVIGANSSRCHAARMRRSKSQEFVMSSESKRSSSESKVSSSQPPSLGIRNFMELVIQLMHLSCAEVNTEVSDRYMRKSIKSFLLTGSQPLNPKMLKDYGHMMAELDRGLVRIRKALLETHTQETMNLVLAVRAGYQQAPSPEGTVPRSGVSDKPFVRHGVKQFITTLSKNIPKEGLYRYLLGVGPDNGSCRRSDYLLSLYEHVKALSFLVHGEAPNKFTASSTEYFRMLDAGPTQILGKLIFVKKIPPRDLEEVAEKLHVNMMQIIVNNCCGRIDISPGLPPFPAPNEVDIGSKRVLNASDDWSGSITHPGVLVMETLTRLVGLVKEYSELESANCVLTPLVMANVVQDVRYYQLISTLAQLKYVDLSTLHEREDKLCFYGNLVNLMTLHVILRRVDTHITTREANKPRSRHSSLSGNFTRSNSTFSRQASLSTLTSPSTDPTNGNLPPTDRQDSLADMKEWAMPSSEVEWFFVQNRMAYHIGQLGVVSLFDLKYFILRNGLPAPECHSGIIYDRCHSLDSMDPWAIYGPSPEPRMMFVISDGHTSSPPLQVLSREMVLNQLKTSMKEYLERTVAVDLEINRVTLPQLLVWYRSDFATEWNQTGLAYEALLHLLPSQMGPKSGQDMLTLLERSTTFSQGSSKQHKGIQVVVQPYSMDPIFVFDYEQFSRIQPTVTQGSMSHRRCTSLPWTPSEILTSRVPVSQHYQTEVSPENLFHLTPASVSYLLSRSELVATLASLVGDIDGVNLNKSLGEKEEKDSGESKPSSKSDSHEEKANTSKNNATTAGFSANIKSNGTESQTTIAEYRHDKLSSEFLYIWMHLLQNIVPLESSDMPGNQALVSDDLRRQFCSKEHPLQISQAILGSPQDNQLHAAMLQVVHLLMLQRNWLSAVRLFQNVPELLLNSHPDLADLHDFACSCVAHTCGISLDVTDMDSNDLWRHLLLIRDTNSRSRAVLGMIQCWPVSVAIELLTTCYHDNRPIDEMLKKAVGTKLEHLKVYEMVIECSKNLLEKSAHVESFMDKLDTASDTCDNDEEEEGNEPIQLTANELCPTLLERLSAWQNVVVDSKSTPERVVQVLLASHEFDHARQWAGIYKANADLRQMIEEKYISFLLESSTPNQTLAFKVLKMQLGSNPEGCLSLCDNLICSLTQPSNTHFIASFILRNLQDYINKYRKEDLFLLSVGCKMLLCLPEATHSNYEHLISVPLLMFEQLLMNAKIEWLKQILHVLRKALSTKHASHSSTFTQTAWDSLIVKFAKKALEFPVVLAGQEEQGFGAGMTRSESRASISSLSSNVSFASQASRMAPSVGPLGVGVRTSPGLPKVGSEPAIGKSMMKSVGSPGSVTLKSALSTTPRLPTTSSTPKAGSPLTALTSSRSFIMPPEPPTTDQWVPDSQATFCMVCEVERFSMFVRRHHCRRCGRVVCAACSSRTMMIRGNSVRTCDDCFNLCFRPKDMDGPGRIQRLREKLSGTPSYGMSEGASFGSAGLETDNVPSVEIHREYVHLLSVYDDENERYREEFYYDQAPSTSLCLSIMELHSSPKECASVLVQLCDDVSKHLQPIAPGVRNPEVDYGLVISMLKYLLFKAKIKFLAASDNAGVGQCDMYLGRLELLKQLVAANCSYIPSMQQLTKIDSLRRLRDRLIEEERLPLAMDVSTKCGIDPAGVWAAWGKAALRAGDYITAREKFSRCLKAPVDKNVTQQPLRLLTDILEHLEANPPFKGVQAEGLLAPLASTKDLLADPRSTIHIENQSGPNSPTYQECMYYLNTYGHHTAVLQFFLKHNQMNKAVHYIQEKHCSKDVFVEGLFVPSLSSGHLNRLQDNMQAVDPTLERWGPYITAMCRYLDKNKLINCLYQTQIFVKDYIRAAMTCITYFYQRGAHSYIDLSPRLQHMLSAKHNLERYLGERQWGSQGGRSGPQPRGPAQVWRSSGSSAEAASLRLILTPGEVSKYINTISLQIDVTKFLNRHHENYEAATARLTAISGSHSPSSPKESTSSKPMPWAVDAALKAPSTLFGSTKMRAEVANLVLVSGNNVNDGFGLAFRIIQDFKLDTNYIYMQAARYFSRLHQYNSVRQLLSCINDSGLSTDVTFDEVISACIRVIASDSSQIKEAESLIKMIRSDVSKINAYVLCGKLRSAYLIAVKGERVEDIKRIGAAADRSGQTAVKKICEKWLAGREEADKLMCGRK